MDEQFVNELAVALRKVGTIHTVGEEWVSYIGEIPVGGVPYCGQMVTRATYSALWSYAQAKGLVKTESEWQQIATANNGNVPFYSDGDGSTTFRMPKLVGYVKGASSQSVAGDYVAEGLPNIEGNLTTENASDANFISDASMGQIGESGAFYISQWTNKYVTSKGGTSLYSPVALDFNPSYSNPIYGNSDHVTPETSTVLFGVYAFGAIVESGELDATTLQTGLARVESSLGGYLPLSGGNVTGNLTVQSKNVVRSVNGSNADVKGNINVSDVAINGDIADLASARGQIGDTPKVNVADLNTMIKAGVYYVTWDDDTTRLNYPSGMNGWLQVFVHGSTIRQIFYRFGTIDSNDFNVFTRQIRPIDNNYGAWVQFVTSKNNKKFGAVTDKGKITSGTVSVDTIVMIHSPQPQDFYINGVYWGEVNNYHGDYKTGVTLAIPAGSTWKVDHTTDVVLYVEVN